MKRNFFIVLCLCSALRPWHSPSADCPSREQFQWQTATPESQGLSSARLETIREWLASRQTKAFLVIRNDKIVYEWYADDHGPTKPHGTDSLAKAIVGGLSLAVA